MMMAAALQVSAWDGPASRLTGASDSSPLMARPEWPRLSDARMANLGRVRFFRRHGSVCFKADASRLNFSLSAVGNGTDWYPCFSRVSADHPQDDHHPVVISSRVAPSRWIPAFP